MGGARSRGGCRVAESKAEGDEADKRRSLLALIRFLLRPQLRMFARSGFRSKPPTLIRIGGGLGRCCLLAV